MVETWEELENSFPNWEIHHTGGGNFVIRKDFLNSHGNTVMVAITDTLALIMKDAKSSNRFITHNEFLEDEDIYWDKAAHLEVPIIYMKEEETLLTKDSNIFSSDILNEIRACIKTINEIIW